MQRVAYGILGLRPPEFWELTPKQYLLMIEGHEKKDESVWNKIAQLASWNTAPHLKNPVTPEKLLNPRKESKRKTTRQHTANVIAELEKDIKVV